MNNKGSHHLIIVICDCYMSTFWFFYVRLRERNKKTPKGEGEEYTT